MSADLVRLSVGIENVEDLLEDLSQAIEKASAVSALSKNLFKFEK